MPPGDAEAGLVDAIVAALLEVDFFEVHGVLRSMSAERLPPGWKDFTPASKRRTLRKIIEGLRSEDVAELARDFVPGDIPGTAGESSGGQVPPAWRPPYSAPENALERYGLSDHSVAPATDASGSQPQLAAHNRDLAGSIFVVHGRDTSIESQTQLLVERVTGRTTVVLHEQITGGRTVIEQIERHGDAARYAIILLTGDDVGGLRGAELQPRARQNVVLELGYFWGSLGRDRVAVLVEDGIELPSDAAGVHYIAIDAGGGWKARLVRELEHAGFDVDWSQLRV